ncbi:hemerythrin domain-containing protein [Noviherbaspirillum sp.]|uniref:hemerythrin domain-containing protein n=1 Tax=Noviherbaspirillum sp. TaxID=1926288 RepID=UPI002FDF6973
MTDLFDTAPGFDQPIAVLKHCHDRIRKQLATLERLASHLPRSGADADAQQAAKAVLRYFTQAAGKHHQDEEQDLLPVLRVVAQGEDAALLDNLMPELLKQHREMDAAWETLQSPLEAIAAGTASELPTDAVRRFSEMYTAHMKEEESHIAPMAKRLFSDAQMQQLGDAMRARRGLTEQ